MSFTFAGLYSDAVSYANGLPAAGVTVTVNLTGTGTAASLYTDRLKSTSAANPLQTNAAGNLTFYTTPGLYDLVFPTGTVTVNVPADASEFADAAAIDVDGTLAANSDTRVASQKATKTYVASQLTAGALLAANNLSDVASASTARGNLGLGSASTQASSAFLATANNLSDVTAATARTNLGLGTAATAASSTFLAAANNLSDVTAATARTNLGLGTAAVVSATGSADVTGTLPALTVVKINGTSLGGLATGILKNTTTTGVPSIAVAADIPLASIGGTGPMPAATALNAITVPAADVSLNTHKITNLTNGSGAQDAAAFGQIPLTGSTIPIPSVGGAAGSATTWMKSDAVPTRDYWTPADYGLVAMTMQPEIGILAGPTMASGTVYVAKVHLDRTTTITTAYLTVKTVGSGLTASQSLVGLYNSGGTLIGTANTNSSATDLATSFTSTGQKIITLTAQNTGLTSLPAGDYRIAVCQVGTTPAIFIGGAQSSLVNGVLTAVNSKYGSADTGRTTTFAASLGTVAAVAGSWNAALS